MHIPAVPGYVLLRCDFHIHTIFSDGLVWPTVRVEEAWREGLDAIAITDHIEYQPHKLDVTTNHNRSFEIARGSADDLGILVVKGSEVTRQMPPGHLNAIFLTNSADLAVKDWKEALANAQAQGAFVFWNHPGWEAQTTNGVVVWYPEHTELVQKGILRGIEVVNGRSYYPEAHRWAIEKRLTMLSNSDIHQPIGFDYHVHDADLRPMTLVFVRENSPEGLKKALFDGDTVLYAADKLIGAEKFLKPIFQRSLQVSVPPGELKRRFLLHIHNDSDLEYQLEANGKASGLSYDSELVLPRRKTVLLQVTAKSAGLPRDSIRLPFKVKNLLVAPGQALEADLVLPGN